VCVCVYIYIYIYRKGGSGLYSIEGRYLQTAGYTESTAEWQTVGLTGLDTTQRNINLMWFWPASSLICGNKMPTRCNRGFYCRSYRLLNMFRAPLCPSSGAKEYYSVGAACGISCCGFQVAGLVWSWGLCVRFAGCCPKHVEQAIRSAIKTSVASSWHFISTQRNISLLLAVLKWYVLVSKHFLC